MDALARFGEYAAAFEAVVANDDWSLVEPFFTDDAVYEIRGGPPFAGRHEGREAVLAYLKLSLDGFDRRFEVRELTLLAGPERRGDSVWLRWRATYRSDGLPELLVDGEETAHFSGDRIQLLRDDIPLEISNLVEHWFSHYGQRLPPAG